MAGLAAVSGSVITEQMNAYKQIIGGDRLTAEGLVKILQLHDSDTRCHGPCLKHIDNFVQGPDGIEWGKLGELLEKIYGDAISTDPYDPQEVHIALTDSLNEVKVMWATMESLSEPFVEYTAVENDWADSASVMSSPAAQYTYTVPMNWYPVFAGWMYETNMEGLEAGKKRYKYRVGGFTSDGAVHKSQEFSFVTAPQPAPHQKTTFAMLGDQGTFMVLGFTVSAKLIQLQDELGVDVVHYAGDLCYAGLSGDLTPFNGEDVDDEFGHIWDLWGIQNEPIAATRPFMTTPGNHESFYNYTAFNNRYKMPYEKSKGNGNYWFSYDYGNVHVISISTEESFEEGSPQMVWVEADMAAAAANRDTVPWIVVSMHRPMYTSEYGMDNGSARTVNMEKLVLQYDVDLVLCGHVHVYERIHPVSAGEVTVFPKKRPNGDGKLVDVYETEGKGPVYVTQGNTGAMQFERWNQPQPDWSAVRFANGFVPPHNPFRGGHRDQNQLGGAILESNYSDTFGFGVSTFFNATHLHYRCIPVTGDVGVDEFWIVKRNSK
jgi:acid phosphatase type 7